LIYNEDINKKGEIYMNIIYIIVAIALGYFVGSIPWALVIGKVFYKTDVREHGSGNLGGTNVGRVLGAKAGLTVMILDIFKAFFAVMIASIVTQENTTAIILCGVAACIGHSYPIFANFKGGKSVSTTGGFVMALAIFVTNDVLFFIVPFLIFMLLLGLSKMVSLSSMVSIASSAAYAIVFYPDTNIGLIMVFVTAFVVYRHRANVKRIIKGKESKVKWIK
jgi:glycerol-3-phosphate acyltransferase PlsY